MLSNYDRTDTPLKDLHRALSRARKYAAHSLNDDELRLNIGCLHDAVQRYRKRVSRRQPEDKVIDFIERAMPLIEDVAERDASFTPRHLPKLLE
jgi:hypothetical protein